MLEGRLKAVADIHWRRYWPLAVIIVLFAGGPFVYGNRSVLFQAMVYLALAQGINILYGFTGYLPFGYVGFFGAGAYGASLVISHWHWPPLAAMAAGGTAAVLLGAILVPLLRLSGAYFAIGSLAASEIVYNVVANPHLKSVTNGPYGIDLSNVFQPTQSYVVMLVVLVLATLIVTEVKHSSFGLLLQAVRDDPTSASMAGVPVVWVRTMAWLISALIAGLAGATFAWHVSTFYPGTVFDLAMSIFAIVFTLFGGRASVTGPLIGVVVLYGLYTAIGLSSPQYFQLIYGLLIVALVLFLPDGVVSLAGRWGIDVE